ncbi:MAG: hypothetical protein HZB65_03105 [Candidatus Aenigmarchaeota archaeon]|nr:hypothetical protein [Candidatus Aenigmarchaeota archaeon]
MDSVNMGNAATPFSNYAKAGGAFNSNGVESTHSDVESALNAAIGVVKDYQWLRLEQALRALTGTWAGFTGYGGTQPDTGITGTIIDTTA